MDLRKTINELKEMQNPMEDYAGMVGAPAFAYGYRYVFPEREDYILQDAIDILEKVDKYRWHNLKENPDDLPEIDHAYEHAFSDDVLVITEEYENPIVAYINLTQKIWFNPIDEEYLEQDFGRVIAWKYVEPFEKSVSLGDD